MTQFTVYQATSTWIVCWTYLVRHVVVMSKLRWIVWEHMEKEAEKDSITGRNLFFEALSFLFYNILIYTWHNVSLLYVCIYLVIFIYSIHIAMYTWCFFHIMTFWLFGNHLFGIWCCQILHILRFTMREQWSHRCNMSQETANRKPRPDDLSLPKNTVS